MLPSRKKCSSEITSDICKLCELVKLSVTDIYLFNVYHQSSIVTTVS